MTTNLSPLEHGEASVLRSVEQKGKNGGGSKRSIYDALNDSRHGDSERAASVRKTKPSFARLVRKVMTEQQATEEGGNRSTFPTESTTSSSSHRGHTRSGSNAKVYDMLTKMKQAKSEPKLDDVFQNNAFHDNFSSSEDSQIAERENEDDDDDRHDPAGGATVDVEQVPVDSTPLLPQEEFRRLKQRKQGRGICSPASIKSFLYGILEHTWLLVFAALLAGLALVLYYVMGNPKLDALPGDAKLPWWCNFFARQIVTLELARLLKYLILDCFILGGALPVRFIGPFVTLLSLQAKGWPFILCVWGILDCVFIQGDNALQNHWLYFTGWKIYSMEANSGLYVLESERYLRILVCMIVAGAATALKRTLLAISFGRRQYATFKPRLEKLLLDVVLLNEVASLSAHAASMFEEMKMVEKEKKSADKEIKATERGQKKITRRTTLNDVTWSSVKKEVVDSSENDENQMDERGFHRSNSSSSRSSSFLKQLLDRWEEPAKQDKMDATIEDVLRFRRALAFMDETYPFGEDFGPATVRDEAIDSAEIVYRNLCKLSMKQGRLPFETIALIALDDDDTYDEMKKSALRRLFHPDADKTLTLFAFVQSCDSLYRRLRYFLATVNNGASLDKVLENVINSLYFFVLGLFLLSLMNYNAWSLLLSMTSLLVSFSFAFGQTVSKYVQGILLIAVTRPFDLGDRIYLTPASDIERNFENAATSYFVEDITLSTTKLRYARTGEVAYLSNHLLADMRIYNSNRSPNATIVTQAMFHISFLDKDNQVQFEKALRKFVDDRPRLWVEVVMVVATKIDPDNEQVFLNIVLRHRESWQSFGRITVHRGDLIRFIHDTSRTLKIAFETPPPRRVLYYGGNLDQGAVVGEEEHRKDLLRPTNVRSSSTGGGMTSRERSESAGLGASSSGSPLPPPYNAMTNM